MGIILVIPLNEFLFKRRFSMEKIFATAYHLFGGIYVSSECREPGRKIVHISDTPSMIYGGIISIIKKIMPDYIIHTGDIVDEVKLELMPQLLERYKIRANDFIRVLGQCAGEKLVIVPGNHDKVEELKLSEKIEICNEGEKISIGSITIGLSHDFKKLPEECDLYMFGHNKAKGNEEYLNGIDYINIVNIDSKKVIRLLYPLGTDDYRLKKGKIGI